MKWKLIEIKQKSNQKQDMKFKLKWVSIWKWSKNQIKLKKN